MIVLQGKAGKCDVPISVDRPAGCVGYSGGVVVARRTRPGRTGMICHSTMEDGSVVSKYLLPCSCGRSVPVEVSHAGRQVRCDCGASLEVPTMLELARLQRVEEAAAPATGQWGVPQQFIMTGIAVLLIAISGGVWLALSVPQLPHPAVDVEKARSEIQSAKPIQTLQIWRQLRRGLPPGANPAMIKYDDQLCRYRIWLGTAAVATVIGAALIAAGLLLMRQNSASSLPENSRR